MAKRRKNDFYPTPAALTLALLNSVPEIKGTTVYEPCNGKGAITKVLSDNYCAVMTGDIDPDMSPGFLGDARKEWPVVNYSNFDWVITNPPFSGSEEIWKNIQSHHLGGLALLLRLTWLEPVVKRERILRQWPPHQLIVLPRTSFTEDGKTDSVTCAWMVWNSNGVKGNRDIHVYSKDDLQRLVENA